jgi:hypothetical protein
LRRLRPLLGDASPAALVVAGAVPFVFLHPHYQPHVAVGQVDADLSDFAILAAVCAGVWSGLRAGWQPLRAGRAVWAAAAAFLALLVASVAWAHTYDANYAVSANLVSAAKFVEYAFLAPAAALALRRPADRRAVYWAVALWSVVVTLIAALQFVGVLDQFRGHHPIDREPSYLGEHDFAAFSGAAFSLGLAAILLGGERALALVGGIAGGLGVALAAALDALGGTLAAAVALWALARRRGPVPSRRTVALAVAVALVALATFTLRGQAVGSFLRFVGVRQNTVHNAANVQTWSQRVLLGYIGLEIWLHHPVVGVGWQESKRPRAFRPYLAGARKHFASRQPPEAFPSPQHMWGVQNGIVQTLSDLGIVGLLLLAALVWAVLRLVVRPALRGPPELAREALVTCGWLVVGLAVFTGTGLIPGVTVDAQLWLGVGIAVALNGSLTNGGYARTP